MTEAAGPSDGEAGSTPPEIEVLVVEDDEIVRKVATAMAVMQGLWTRTVGSGRHAACSQG